MSSSLPEPPEDGSMPSACVWVRGELAGFLAGELSLKGQARLRAHLRNCSACRERFDEGMGLAARVNHGPRRARRELARDERRAAQRTRAWSGATRSPGRSRAAHLRLLLLPALAVFLFTQVSRGPRVATAAQLTPVAGEVQLGDGRLGDAQAHAVQAGQLCATGADGRARLQAGDGVVQLEPSTWLWLESARAPRLRLGGGAVHVEGRATVTSRAGVVEVEGGAARVQLQADGLAVEALAGEVRVVDSRGARELVPGRSARLALPGAAPVPGTPIRD